MKKLLVFLLLWVGAVKADTTVTQYVFTLTWVENRTVGQYANGDYWIVGPITITNITPASTKISGRVINGAMVNPTAGLGAGQGFDSDMKANTYISALNAARNYNDTDISVGNPLVLAAGSSLVVSKSVATGQQEPGLTDAAVFTVVASAPAAGQFRPPYCGSDKTSSTVTHNKSQLNYSILPHLTPTAHASTPAQVQDFMQRPWIEINTQYSGSDMHPINNQDNYGRDMTFNSGAMALVLCLNYTDAQLETLYVRFVQYGLDVYGSAVSGGEWRNNGGWNMGRKLPLVVAGEALNDSSIRFYSDKTNFFKFQDDQNCRINAPGDVGVTVDDQYLINGRLRLKCVTDMVGLPDWNITGVADGAPSNYASNWTVVYRNSNYCPSVAHALVANLITGVRPAWNYTPYFDFMDRAFVIDGASSPNITTFCTEMWNAYRAGAGNVYTPPSAPSCISGWIPVDGLTINVEFTDNVSMGAAGASGFTLATSSPTPLTTTGTFTRTGTTSLSIGLNRVPLSNEVITISYTQPGTGLNGTRTSTNVANFSTHSVNNYSASAPPAPPAAPTNLVATPVSSYQINLTWAYSGVDADVQIEISADGAMWAVLTQQPTDPASYQSVGLIINTRYYYRVKAFNLGGDSAYTNTANALTITPSGSPVNFRRQGLLLSTP